MTDTDFVKQSFLDPAGVARGLLRQNLSRVTLWSMVATVAILSVILVEIGSYLLSGSQASSDIAPFTLTLILGSSLVVLIFAIYLTGRAFGGEGRIDQAILLVAWWQGIGLLIQIVQTVFLLIFPPLAGIVTVLGLAWLLFALIHLVNELHGFGSLFKSLGCVALGILGFSFGIALFLTLIGVSVQGGPV